VFRAFSSHIRATRATFLGPAAGVSTDMRAVEHLRLEPVAEDRLRRCAAALEQLETVRARAMPMARRGDGGGGGGGGGGKGAAQQAAVTSAARSFLIQYESWRASL
jgi:hypothetical protein